MTEAPKYFPALSERSAFDPPFSKIRTIPYHLRRRVLKQIKIEEGHIPEKLWTQRARAVEVYVQDVVETQKEIVKRVEINEDWDKEGPDLIVYFVDDFGVKKARIEAKSSTLELNNGKRKIRGEIFLMEANGQLFTPWTKRFKMTEWAKKTSEERQKIISDRLTEKGILLVNGGEKDKKEKTPLEILNESIFPQLERMWLKERSTRIDAQAIELSKKPTQIPKSPGQLALFLEVKSVQVFPEAA